MNIRFSFTALMLVFASVTFFSCMNCKNNQDGKYIKHRVIIDTDMVNAYDDGLAYLLLAAQPDVEVLGVTTVTGNTWAPEGMAYAIRQGEIAKATNTKFIIGSKQPLRSGRLEMLPEQIRRNPGEDWIGSIGYDRVYDWKEHYVKTYGEQPTLYTTNMKAEDFIIEQIRKYPDEVTILAIGPCTNIAKALKKDPEIAELANRIIYMGGAVFCEGNTTPYAEMNFLYDPDAANICLHAPFQHQILVSLDVCNNITINYDEYFTIYDSIKNEKLKDVFQRQYFYEKFKNDKSYTNLMWDIIAASLVLDEELITKSKVIGIDVDDNPQSPTYGKSIANTSNPSNKIVVPLLIYQPSIIAELASAMAKF